MDIKLKTQFNNPRLPLIPIPGFHDDFNRPAGDLTTTTDGKPWQLHMSNSTLAFVLTGDGTAGYSGSGGNDSYAVVDALTADGTLTTKILNVNPDNTQTGLCARFVDLDNHLWISGGSSGGPLRIYERLNGTLTMLANSSRTPASGDVIAVTLDGPAVAVSVNGAPLMTADVTVSGTRHGIHARGSNGAVTTEWDYVTFTP